MLTDSECLACFTRQSSATVRLNTHDADVWRIVEDKVGSLLPQLDTSLSPPENAVEVYALIAEITGIPDPYRNLRRQSNVLALSLRDEIRNRIKKSVNPVRTAIHYAIAANIIDYGAQHQFDAMHVLATCLQQDFAVDDTEELITHLQGAEGCKVLYLADNSGEIVFDGLLVEELREIGCEVTLAVRESPILNDVTLEDAVACGIDKICRVITNGTGCPGTPLTSCSEEFRSVFRQADIIISKGQGNFETLSEVNGPIFFLLTVKCPVVGQLIADMRKVGAKGEIGYGEMILMQRSR